MRQELLNQAMEAFLKDLDRDYQAVLKYHVERAAKLNLEQDVAKIGTASSGNHGHKGRAGVRGGSAPGGGRKGPAPRGRHDDEQGIEDRGEPVGPKTVDQIRAEYAAWQERQKAAPKPLDSSLSDREKISAWRYQGEKVAKDIGFGLSAQQLELAGKVIVSQERTGERGVNAAYRAVLEDGTVILLKHQDAGLAENEVIAYHVAKELGAHVPLTVHCESRGQQGTIRQLWIEKAETPMSLGRDKFGDAIGAGEAEALLDGLMAQQDRHSGNVLYDGSRKRVVNIDNGVSFPKTVGAFAPLSQQHGLYVRGVLLAQNPSMKLSEMHNAYTPYHDVLLHGLKVSAKYMPAMARIAADKKMPLGVRMKAAYAAKTSRIPINETGAELTLDVEYMSWAKENYAKFKGDV